MLSSLRFLCCDRCDLIGLCLSDFYVARVSRTVGSVSRGLAQRILPSLAILTFHVIVDRILSFLVVDNHLFFFYSSGANQELFGPVEMESIRQRLGRMTQIMLRQCLHEICEGRVLLESEEYEWCVQGCMVYVPFTYMAPALPHAMLVAAVC